MNKFFSSIKNRFSEPSTYVAIGAIALGIPPETVATIATVIDSDTLNTAGLITAGLGVLMGEKGRK